MTNIIGMDSGAVRQLAGELRSHASTLSGVVATVDNVIHQIGRSWQGTSSTEFVNSWQRLHRPALLAAQAAIAGLATSAQNNAEQQDETSAATGSAPGGFAASAVSGGSSLIGEARRAIMDHTRGDSYLLGPVLTAIPIGMQHLTPKILEEIGGAGTAAAFGTVTSVVSGVDGAARTVQDVAEGHGTAAVEQGLSTTGGEVLSAGVTSKDPVVILAGTDLLLANEVVKAGSAVNWDELYHDPGELNPFAPGALSGVWQSETAGFKQLGESIVGSL